MLPGPLFWFELRAIARRNRTYYLRVMVAGTLSGLFLLFHHFLESIDLARRISLAVDFRDFFITIAGAEGLLVLLWTPASVAGTIAGLRKRKALPALLASPLSSAEIVLGTLTARLVPIVTTLLVGLPILCLLTLMGGVGPGQVVALILALIASAVWVGGIAILCSTAAPGPREAIVASYGITLLWLLLPLFLNGPIQNRLPAFHARIEPMANLLATIDPIAIGETFTRADPVGPMLQYAWRVAALGVLLAGISVAALKIIERSDFRVGKWSKPRFRRRENFPGFPIGDRPMIWKETRITRWRGPIASMGRVASFVVLLGLSVEAYYLAVPAFREVVRDGLGVDPFGSAREEFHDFLGLATLGLYLFTGLGVAVTAGLSILSEREQETWISLVSTPLEGEEILVAKRKGAIRRARPVLLGMVILWTVGLICGATHPVEFVALNLSLFIYIRFLAALGGFASLQAKGAMGIAGIILGALVCANIGYLFCCLPMRIESGAIFAGCTPLLMADPPFSYFGPRENRNLFDHPASHAFAWILSCILYGSAAVLLNIVASLQFDRAVDRPCPWAVPGRR